MVPGLLGVFCGAPLMAAELESGSFRLAWTQDVSRVRWLGSRLAVSGLAAMAAAGLASWLVTWWAGPLDRVGLNQFGWFDSRGLVPAGYAAFAFALGALAGTLLKLTVPAMAVTLVVFTAVRVTFRLLARPRLFPPVTRVLALDPATTGYGSSSFLPVVPASTLQPAAPHLPNAWVTSVAVVNGKGEGLTRSELSRTCPAVVHRPRSGGPAPGGHSQAPPSAVSTMHHCVARLGRTYHEVVTYQPAGRYWPLQWLELGVFVAAALLLAGVCLWRVRRIG